MEKDIMSDQEQAVLFSQLDTLASESARMLAKYQELALSYPALVGEDPLFISLLENLELVTQEGNTLALTTQYRHKN